MTPHADTPRSLQDHDQPALRRPRGRRRSVSLPVLHKSAALGHRLHHRPRTERLRPRPTGHHAALQPPTGSGRPRTLSAHRPVCPRRGNTCAMGLPGHSLPPSRRPLAHNRRSSLGSRTPLDSFLSIRSDAPHRQRAAPPHGGRHHPVLHRREEPRRILARCTDRRTDYRRPRRRRHSAPFGHRRVSAPVSLATGRSVRADCQAALLRGTKWPPHHPGSMGKDRTRSHGTSRHPPAPLQHPRNTHHILLRRLYP